METVETLPPNAEDAVSEEPSPEVSSTASPPLTAEDFEHRVTKLMELMESDPKNRDRIIAEIYVNIASAEMGIRGVFEAIQTQGISGLMKGAFRRGK